MTCGSSDSVTASGGGSLEWKHNCRGDMFDYKDPRNNNSRINEYNWFYFYRGAEEAIPPKKLEARWLSSSCHQFISIILLTRCGMLFYRWNISYSVDSSSSECLLKVQVYCKVLNDKWHETSNQSVIQPDNPCSSLTNLSTKSLTKTLNTPPYLTQELLQ